MSSNTLPSPSASTSSPSSTPMVLTPDTTGDRQGATASAEKTPKANRRQTAVYNPAASSLVTGSSTGSTPKLKPFSRSAAKRESVLALGSIEHLQHYFSQAGIASKKNPLLEKFRAQGLVPAIGGLGHVPVSPDNAEGSHIASLDALLAQQQQQSRQAQQVLSPHVRTHEVHPDSLLPGVIFGLAELAKAWEDESKANVDVVGLLKTSTRAIYNVRNYILSLDDDSTATIRDRTSLSSSVDPLAQIRRSSLEVLACLRDIEEQARLPLSDDAYDAQSDGGPGGSGGASGSWVASPSTPPLDGAHPIHDPGITFSFVQVNGKVESVPVWVNDDDFDPFEDDTVKKERWDQRLELGNGWLYRRDISPSELVKERSTVAQYIELVDTALFSEDAGDPSERNFERARRRLEARAGRLADQSTGGSIGSLGRRARSKNRRVSAGEAMATGSATANALFIDTNTGGKRRISTGVLGLGKQVTEEPESMGGISEPAIEEEDEEEMGECDEGEEVEDHDLPKWAQRTSFPDDDLGRAYTFLMHFLPQPYQYALIPPSEAFSLPPPSPSPHYAPDAPLSASRTNFLSCLSSGQLLCLAYNSCVRKSKHPWGFVSKDGIHDVLGLEAKERERESKGASATEGGPTPTRSQIGQAAAGWTFRRTDNLRLWAGGLKLRYLLPIHMPSQVISVVPPSLLQLPVGPSAPPLSRNASQGSTGTSPIGNSISRSPSPATPSRQPAPPKSPLPSPSNQNNLAKDKEKLTFDAKVVARKDEGWEDILETLLLKWMWKSIEEMRRV